MQNWGAMSRAERDAAYDNGAAVANSAALNAERIAASAAFRGSVPGALDLAYGPGERQKWDIYPAADASAPCLAFIHGGYWQRGRREEFACLGEGLRARGWSVAMAGYTLAPEARLSQIVGEVTAALDWLAAHGEGHGVAGPVVLSGWSAGAHLVAMALGHPRVAAGLAVSGVYELGPLRDTAINEKLRLDDAEVAALSPLRLAPVSKTLAIAYGTRELAALAHDSRHLHGLRSEAHIAGALVPVAGADHFTVLDGLRRADGVLVRAAVEALA